MYIRCWGSRGSIPVSGKAFEEFGGDTTCMEIRSRDGDVIIIDGGSGIRRLGNQLMSEGLTEFHLIFTHIHWDHILGVPFFRPLYMRETTIHVYRCPNSGFIQQAMSYMMNPPYFPVPFDKTAARIIYHNEIDCDGGGFEIGPIHVESIPLRHPNTARGYKFTEDGKTFAFLTDNELHYAHPGGVSYEEYVTFCKDVDLLIHDSDYTPTEYEKVATWGHSTYLQTLDFALEAGVKKLGLFHLNQDRTDIQVREIVNECQEAISRRDGDMECLAVGSDMIFEL